MLYQKCVRFEDQTICGLRFVVKIQYKHTPPRINFKAYFSYIFHPILIKLDMYYHWANVILKGIQIRNSTHWGHQEGHLRKKKINYFN